MMQPEIWSGSCIHKNICSPRSNIEWIPQAGILSSSDVNNKVSKDENSLLENAVTIFRASKGVTPQEKNILMGTAGWWKQSVRCPEFTAGTVLPVYASVTNSCWLFQCMCGL